MSHFDEWMESYFSRGKWGLFGKLGVDSFTSLAKKTVSEAQEVRVAGDGHSIKFSRKDLELMRAQGLKDDVVVKKDQPTSCQGALNTQVGGSHHSTLKIQPIEYIHANGLDFFQGNIVKYITRYKMENGAEDVRKIIHYCQLILQLQYGEELDKKDQSLTR